MAGVAAWSCPRHRAGAAVLCGVLGRERVHTLRVPFGAYAAPAEANAAQLKFTREARVAVFVERVFEHPGLEAYDRRILLPNPEWLTPRDVDLSRLLVTDVWHKTQFSIGRVRGPLPEARHRYLGFTSPAMLQTDADFGRFAHFPGPSRSRHTQEIVNIWRRDPALPEIRIHRRGGSLELPEWIGLRNMRFRFGALDQATYSREFTRHGIHLCTSQVEDFGHYVNEARSMGALVIALDAPPMNELVDRATGVLIPVHAQEAMNHGVRSLATEEAIRAGILEGPDRRREVGALARRRYLDEGRQFAERLRAAVSEF